MESTEDLARRAVACKGWRWLPGMRVVSQSGQHWRIWSETRSVYEPEGIIDCVPTNDLPDLTDPATLGCLLALVREAWGDHVWLPTCVDLEAEAWIVGSPSRNRQTRYDTEAAALVAALEAAP